MRLPGCGPLVRRDAPDLGNLLPEGPESGGGSRSHEFSFRRKVRLPDRNLSIRLSQSNVGVQEPLGMGCEGWIQESQRPQDSESPFDVQCFECLRIPYASSTIFLIGGCSPLIFCIDNPIYLTFAFGSISGWEPRMFLLAK